MKERTYKALFLFAGLGGGALGFQRARSAFRGIGGRFETVGAVDFDAAAARDFERLTGHPCAVGDLSTMTPGELRAVCGGQAPDVLFTSPPCKSFSGCLPSATACTPKYQEMADLAVRGLFLTLEAFPEHPPRLVLLENVPRIQNRGRHLLDILVGMLRSYGYATRETVHDCGELGGLAQRRRRFLLVARHVETTGDWWREPPKQRVRGVGEVLGELPIPLPGSADGGPMHRLPRLSAMNWLRLALIPAGGDWRNLPDAVRLEPRAGRQNGGYGVESWTDPGHAVLGEGSVRNTRASVADPRMGCEPRNTVLGVVSGDQPAGTVLGSAKHDNGAFSVADPRVECRRNEGGHGVLSWSQPSYPVIGHPSIHNWPAAVADPREHGLEVGHVVQTQDGPIVVGVELDLSNDRPLDRPPILIAADGTWHRPMTTLELAALQSLPTRIGGEWLVLDGARQAGHRERIGNAVPVDTAEAVATTALSVLLSSDAGVVTLGGEAVWVEDQRDGTEASA